jgi:DNA replication protein DnaD
MSATHRGCGFYFTQKGSDKMSGKGWIALDRQIFDNWIWQDKPFAYGQAWIDMIMQANYTDRQVLIDKTPIVVEKGSFITSELKLMDRWGWSKSKVRRFLDLLQNEKMIVKKTDHKKTTIKLVNYSVYNESQTTERPQKDHRKTIREPSKDTTNNITNKQLNKDVYSAQTKKIGFKDFKQSELDDMEEMFLREVNRKVNGG